MRYRLPVIGCNPPQNKAVVHQQQVAAGSAAAVDGRHAGIDRRADARHLAAVFQLEAVVRVRIVRDFADAQVVVEIRAISARLAVACRT